MTEPAHDLHAAAGHAYQQADVAERRWNLLVLAMVGFIILFVTATSVRFALSPPSNVQTIVPATLHLRGEFIEENLGTVLNSDGSATVRFIAEPMIVPGYVSQVSTRFDTPGTYAMPCHEFCGLGHHAMWGSVHVVPLSAWPGTGATPVACSPR